MTASDRVWEALKHVRYLGYSRDIVSFGLVRGVAVGDGAVSVSLAIADLPEATRRALGAAVAAGVHDALPDALPVKVEAVSRERKRPGAAPQVPRPAFLEHGSRTNVWPIASGKGGVGKSTVTVNLAAALARRGRRVGLIDADVYGFSVPRMLGVHGHPAVRDGAIVPLERAGVRVISLGMLVETDEAVIWRGPMLHKTLTTFLAQVAWGELDDLLLDLPPGTGDVSITLAQELPKASMIIVTTPQEAAVEVASRAARLAEKVNMVVAGVIENMSFFVPAPGESPLFLFGRGGGRALADGLGVPLLAEIPLDPRVREGGDRGDPVVLAAPRSPAARAFAEAADRLLAAVATPAASA